MIDVVQYSNAFRPTAFEIVVLSVAVLTIGHTVQSLVSRRLRQNKIGTLALQKGCKVPPTLQYRWPLAIDIVVKAFRADKAGGILHLFLDIIQATGTTFQQIILGSRSLGTIDPRNIEAILSSQFNEFGFGVRAKNFHSLLGDGIFTQHGPPWKASRDLLRPQFMHTKSENFVLIQDDVESFMDRLAENVKRQRTVDLQPDFFKLTLQTTMDVLVGRQYLASQDPSDEAEFGEAFNEAQHYLASRGRLGDFYWLIDDVKFRSACRKVHSYVDRIVQSALADPKNSSSNSTEQDRYVFLHALIRSTRNPIAIRDQILNILLAGRDTTACLLSWTIRLLAQHQDVQDKLRQECLNLPSFLQGSLPNKTELKHMSYLDIVLREVLRLYPSVPVNVRTALQDTTLPFGGGADGSSPIFVKSGEDVGYCVYAMHRSRDIYGPDADAFRPNRWLPGSNTQTDVGDAGWGYLPFNGGPRICLGREFALLEASYVIVRLLQAYTNIELDTRVSKPANEKHTLTLVLSSADGCNVVLTPR